MQATLLPSAELRRKRDDLLARLHGSEQEIYTRAHSYMLNPGERAIFRQIEALDFILGIDEDEHLYSKSA